MSEDTNSNNSCRPMTSYRTSNCAGQLSLNHRSKWQTGCVDTDTSRSFSEVLCRTKGTSGPDSWWLWYCMYFHINNQCNWDTVSPLLAGNLWTRVISTNIKVKPAGMGVGTFILAVRRHWQEPPSSDFPLVVNYICKPGRKTKDAKKQLWA